MAKRKTQSQAAAKSEAKSPVTFLVVDDDEGARQIIVDYLKAFGYDRVIEAEDGKEALSKLEGQSIDFVISDWEMPEANGLELLRALKTDARFRHIPFIMVTSPISQERYKIEDAALAKVDGYIIKPFRSDVLREKIDRALSEIKFEGRNGVLVVDDDDDVRATIIEYVRRMGHEPVFEASDGDQAFEMLKKCYEMVALVISDWEMPRLAGIDLLKRIRADEELASIPFIMVTSQTSIERVKVKQALESDVDNYLLKPFRVEDLQSKIHDVLRRAKAQAGVEIELKRAEGYIDVARWPEAIRIYNQIIKGDPSNTRAYLGMATAQKHLAPEKAIPNATQYIRKAIAINPQNPQAHIDLALTFESAMSLEKAIGCLREAMKYCAFSEQIHFHLGRLLLRRGNQSEGRKELKKAIEIKSDFKEAEELLSGGKDE